MSYYHENVVWQVQNGDWYIGFFARISGGFFNDEDYDSEWDDDFDYDRFEWVSGPHSTEREAILSYDGGNPGGHMSITYTDDNKGSIEKYNALYTAYKENRSPVFRGF